MWVKRTWQWTPFPHHIKRRNKIFNGILWIRPLMRGYRAKYAESFWTFPLVNKKKNLFIQLLFSQSTMNFPNATNKVFNTCSVPPKSDKGLSRQNKIELNECTVHIRFLSQTHYIRQNDFNIALSSIIWLWHSRSGNCNFSFTCVVTEFETCFYEIGIKALMGIVRNPK